MTCDTVRSTRKPRQVVWNKVVSSELHLTGYPSVLNCPAEELGLDLQCLKSHQKQLARALLPLFPGAYTTIGRLHARVMDSVKWENERGYATNNNEVRITQVNGWPRQTRMCGELWEPGSKWGERIFREHIWRWFWNVRSEMALEIKINFSQSTHKGKVWEDPTFTYSINKYVLSASG